MATHQPKNIQPLANATARESKIMPSSTQSESKHHAPKQAGARIPSAVLARLQVMFTSGASLEEVCEALEIDTAIARDAADAPIATKPINPPRLSDKKLDALTSLSAALRHQVAALIQTSEADGADYAHVVGPITATAHALALEIDDLRHDNAEKQQKTTMDAKARIARQRSGPVANDDSDTAKDMTPVSDLHRLKAVSAQRGPNAKIKVPGIGSGAPFGQTKRESDAMVFEDAARNASNTTIPRVNPLADVLARARSSKIQNQQTAQTPKATIKAATKKPNVNVAKDAVSDAASSPKAMIPPAIPPAIPTPIIKKASTPTKSEAFDNIASQPIVRLASKPGSALSRAPQPSAPRHQVRTPQIAPVNSGVAPANQFLARPASVPQTKIRPQPIKRFEPSQSGQPTPSSQPSDGSQTKQRPSASSSPSAPTGPSTPANKPERAPYLKTRSVDAVRLKQKANPFRDKMSAAMTQINSISKDDEAFDDEAFSDLR